MTRTILCFALCLFAARSGAHDFPLPAGISGSWYDLSRPGEGWIVQMLDDERAVVAWFTHVLRNGKPAQFWLIGTGEVVDDIIEIAELEHFAGPVFGPGYDPNALTRSTFGPIALGFETCAMGELSYDGGDLGSALRPIDRLTNILGLPCPADAPPGAAFPTGITGAWFDPSQSGSGFFFEELPDGRVNVYWFTYDSLGQPAWMTGVGQRDGAQIIFELVQPLGTGFGDAFDASAITQVPWGSMIATMLDCSTVQVAYASEIDAFGSGTLTTTRLTQPRDVECSAPAPLRNGSWREIASPPTPRSELSVAELDGAAYVSGGFGGPTTMESYRLDSDSWTIHPDMPVGRNHHMTVGHNGEIFILGGYADSSFASTRSALAYNPESQTYRTLAQLPTDHAAAGQAVSFENRIYLAGGTSRAVLIYDPADDRWEQVLRPGVMTRDHSTAVLFDREIWVLAGRSNLTGAFRSVAIFDPESRAWREGPTMVAPHSGFAAAVVQGQIMAVGGELNTGPDAATPLTVDDFEIYAREEGRWQRAPDLPIALHGIGAAQLNGRLFIAGGSVIANSVTPAGRTFIYEPATAR